MQNNTLLYADNAPLKTREDSLRVNWIKHIVVQRGKADLQKRIRHRSLNQR